MESTHHAPEGDTNLSPGRQAWAAAHIGATSQSLLDRDSAAFLHQSLSTPCLNALRSAQGSWIEDVEGRRYLDFHGNSVHQVGHGHPRVVEAVVKQLQTLPFSPRRYTNEPAVELAERLRQANPFGLTKVLFAPGGGSAVGIALKLARVATGRHKTVSMWGSFHGASLEESSVGGEDTFRRGLGPLMTGTEHAPPADPRRCPLGCGGTCTFACASYLEYVLDQEKDVAAVVAEPVRSTTAVAPPPGYWQRVRAACDKHGTLLIFDEIPTCLGRTGHLFASEASGVRPDIAVLGKGLGGGVVPIAAVLARPELDVAGHIALGHYTHEKSPVGCAAALATLDVIADEGLVKRSRSAGTAFVGQLEALRQRHPVAVEARGIGLLCGLELSDPAVADRVLYDSLSRGLSYKVSSGTVLTLTPPLNATDDELARAIEILDAGLSGTAP